MSMIPSRLSLDIVEGFAALREKCSDGDILQIHGLEGYPNGFYCRVEMTQDSFVLHPIEGYPDSGPRGIID